MKYVSKLDIFYAHNPIISKKDPQKIKCYIFGVTGNLLISLNPEFILIIKNC